MPEPLDNFFEAAKKNNVDDVILDTPAIENTLNKLENFGKDLCESVEKLIKKQPAKPSGPTPTYQESAFIKPKEETTLYNVTNSEDKVPVVTKSSNLFKNLSYNVHGFSASAAYKKDSTEYSIYAGEKKRFRN